MKNWAQVIDGRVTQRAIGFEEAPFQDAIEVPQEVIANPDDWRMVGDNWEYTPVPPTPADNLPTNEERLAALEAAMLGLLGV